ncbi:MAG: 5'-nucleotidase C-terminal domain-containing protein, partial [Ilumatobacteraceae bacterium]
MARRQSRLIGIVALAAVTTASLVASSSPTSAQVPPTETIQVLGINDFHGRIQSSTIEGGAAVLAGAVAELQAAHPDTVFAAAGDLIGASTFESFVQQDKPTIDALNAAGLDVSAVGNHEFDQGFGDLVNRVMAPYDPVTNPRGGAEWAYLGANVRNTADGTAALPESWIQDFGDIRVGFVGAVTDHLPELVSPAGIAGLTIEEPVVAANRTADRLKDEGADVIILLVHEGAATTALSSATDPTSDFGEIVTGANENIDAIISGHTHLAYNHPVPVQAWVDEGRPVTTRPVVSAGQYGYNLNQLLFEVDPVSGDVRSVSQNLLPLIRTVPAVPPTTPVSYVPNYTPDPAVAAIVAAAVAQSAVAGAREIGQIAGPFNRATVNPTTPAENRGGESTLGNLVAEVQRWATEAPTSGGAQIAFMNPGGLRQDMAGKPATPAYPTAVTFQQAAVVQPFANTLVNMQLTGAQLKTVLEQQWQPAGSARPFLRLGISAGFTYTYDPAAAAGSHITQMWLNGALIDPAASYSVTVNSFLAAGGDNFLELANGSGKRDPGKVDLAAMVDYMAAETPVTPDRTQRSFGVSFPAGAPAVYAPGDTVAFDLSSLSLARVVPGFGEVNDTSVTVALDGTTIGSFAVDSTIGTDPFDEVGKAHVEFTVPRGLAAGPHTITITGDVAGSTTIPLTTVPGAAVSTTTLKSSAPGQVYGSSNVVTLTATVAVEGVTPVPGSVDFVNGDVVVATVPLAADGTATYTLPATQPAGTLTFTAVYAGTDDIDGSTSTPVT